MRRWKEGEKRGIDKGKSKKMEDGGRVERDRQQCKGKAKTNRERETREKLL